MAVPNFLSSAYRYKTTAAVTDVNTIIADLHAELVTGPGASDKWIDNGGTGVGPWQSPTRSDGVFITITVSRISATRIAYVVKDQYGLQVNNLTDTRQNIDAGGTEVRYYTGPFHCCVDSVRATPEAWATCILDQYPEDLSIIPQVIATVGPNPTAGTPVANQNLDMWWLRLQGGTAYTSAAQYTHRLTASALTCDFITLSGSYMFAPLTIGDTTSTPWMKGRVPQSLCVDDSIAFGTVLTVQIDDATTGDFKVAGHTTSASNGLPCRLAWRKA